VALVLAAAVLLSILARLGTANSQGECYLTDVLGLARADGHPLKGHPRPHSTSTQMTSRQSCRAISTHRCENWIMPQALRCGRW